MGNSTSGISSSFYRFLQSLNDEEENIIRLVEAENRFRILVEENLVGIYITQNNRFLYINPKFAEIFGYKQDELFDSHIMKIIAPEDENKVMDNLKKRLDGEILKLQYEFRGKRKNGDIINVEVLGSQVEYKGTPAILGTLINITDRKKNEEQLRLAYKVLDNTTEGVAVTDEAGSIQWINPAFTKITGYNIDEVLGKNPRILRSDHHDKEFYSEMWRNLVENGQWQGEIWNRRKSGEIYPEWLTISAIKDEYGNIVQYVSVFNDMTERIRQEEHIKHQAYHDALTGLPNKFLFKDRLDSSIIHAARHKEMIGVIFLGLDRFKRINETLGHAIGDEVLKEVARRLSSAIKADDTVARFSGDTFVLMVKEIPDTDNIVLFVNEILDILTVPYDLKGKELYITASVGMSLYPVDGEESDILLKNAETAMFRSEEMGRNSFQLYTPSMNEKALSRLSMENDLHKALRQNEFVLHYQPQIEANTGKIVGAEALIRWQHPTLGLLKPGEFISLAEETGLIVPLGEWVLQEACFQNNKWQSMGLPQITIGVNLSPIQFIQSDLIDKVEEIIKQSGLSPEYLDLEITESNAMKNADYTNKTLRCLKEMGINISIDDFGTGYSSLAYLIRFPIDRIKIDQSFVRDIPEDREQTAITLAIIAMAKSLGIRTIAEGVESIGQLNFLRQQNCYEIQGYYFSPPVDSQAFENLLKKEYLT